MPRNDITSNICRLHAPFPGPEPPSAELEQNALREFDDQDRPAVQAIFHARRRERALTFFVAPAIAASHGLSKRALERAMDRLEGRLIETVYQERGELRRIRLLPDWENPEALAGDPVLKIQEAFYEAAAKKSEAKLPSEIERYLYPNLTHPPEILAELRRLLERPSDP